MGEIRCGHTLVPGQLVSPCRDYSQVGDLRVIHFARVGASVKEDWPGGASWCGGRRALEEEAEGSQGLSPGQGELEALLPP